MNRNKPRKWGLIIIFPVVLIGVITMCFLFGIVYSVPERAEEIYGPPAPGLGAAKTYYQSLILILYQEKLTARIDPPLPPQEFIVESGDSPWVIISRLKDAGYIDQPDLFRTYLIYSGIDRQIKAGPYLLSASQSDVEIAKTLGGPGPDQTIISVLPGWRTEEITDTFEEAGLQAPPADFISEVNRRKLEGFLYPDQYQVHRSISAADLADQMYQNFLSQISPELETAWDQQGFSVSDAVILASIIEKEAVMGDEKPQIASVFINRLNAGMTLSADPTVQYALGYDSSRGGWWPTDLTYEDFENPSPYNTYIHDGLPPGAICNPGLESLRAVAFPAETAFLFFRSACDGTGKHLFSETYQEHLENACEAE